MAFDVSTTTGNGHAAAPSNGAAPFRGAILRPDADVYETDDHVVVVADVPGALPEDVDVRLERRVLTIRARVNGARPQTFRRIDAENDAAGYERAFTLPEAVDGDGIEAHLEDGVLTLRLPKAESARTRRIPVAAA